MMPIPDANLQPVEHQIDYKQKYKALKKKLKFLVYEQECFLEELRKAQRKLLKISRDRSFLLDRLLQHEKIEDSSGDSDATASSDSEVEGSSANRKRKAMTSPGQLPYGIDPSLYAGGALTPASASMMMAAEPSKKKARTSAKKGGISKGKGSLKDAKTSQMTREELERHLESKQNAFGIEKAPAMLPMEIFSNENSNPDSESAQDTPKEEDDSDLVVDAGL